MSVQYKKILVPLDGSALANQALPHAQMLATSLGAKLILFRAVEEAYTALAVTRTATIMVESEYDKQPVVIRQAERDLSKLIEQTELHNVHPQIAVEAGDPAKTIVEYAGANEIDLIVMSTHGRTGLARLVYGSVAEKVLHTATCPVLLIRSAIG
jgi:nucleotide-binding universal stress UspA family protein